LEDAVITPELLNVVWAVVFVVALLAGVVVGTWSGRQ
jgi:uncharacterized protein YneF (UPF0154 family)